MVYDGANSTTRHRSKGTEAICGFEISCEKEEEEEQRRETGRSITDPGNNLEGNPIRGFPQGELHQFTHRPMIQNWRPDNGSSLLGVSADPGCGKSVLAKYLVDGLLPLVRNLPFAKFSSRMGSRIN